jgi:CRISPR-associated protein Cas1
MPYVEWKKMGFSKGTLHYMKQNAKGDKPFTLNAHVREKLNDGYFASSRGKQNI